MAGKFSRSWVVVALVLGASGSLVPDVAWAKPSSNQKKSDAKADPAAEASAAVDRAAKLLAASKPAEAERYLSSALSTGKLPRKTMARALYLRGLAHRKQNKSALAISDLTSALWVQNGLTDAERRDATDARNAAYREAGITNPDAPATATTAANSAASPPQRSGPAPAPTPGWQSVTRATPAPRVASAPAPAPDTTSPSSGGGISSFFSGFFGGSSSPPPTTSSTSPTVPPPAPASRPPAQPSVSAWNSEVKPRTATAGPASTRAPQPSAQPVKAQKTTAARGGYILQITAVRNKSDADAIVTRVQKAHARHLAGRQLSVDKTVVGNMGAFYRVKAGPYESSAEHRALCDALRKEGLDCLEIRQQ